MSSTNNRVHLITSAATLLSGGLDDCQPPDYEVCPGGVAAVRAFARHYAAKGNITTDKQLMIQWLDMGTPFVNMHPLQWVVNRLILHFFFGFNVFVSTPSLLNQNKVDSEVTQRDISGLQTLDLPFLLSNVAVPPTNSWHEYMKAVHFDKATGLAVISIVDDGVPMTVSQVESAAGALNHIAQVNQRNGCNNGSPTEFQEYYIQTSPLFTDIANEDSVGNGTLDTSQCWVSVILYSHNEESYATFLKGILGKEGVRPDLIVQQVDAFVAPLSFPQLSEDTGVWISNCAIYSTSYCQHEITIQDGTIRNVTYIQENIFDLNETMKDVVWLSDVSNLAVLAADAKGNNPVIGYTGFIPVMRIGSYHACNAGECAVGNLFTDSLRWRANSDIAFTSSGGYRGPGKPAGKIRFSDLYAALPFPNTMCEGVMSGLSLFNLLNYTTSVATFQSEISSDGGRLLQLSGMTMTYNTNMQGSRLIAVEIWDRDVGTYLPLDRLRLYTFATDSYVCGVYDPYPALTGGDFVLDGEVPGVIGDLLHQNLLADYLMQLDEPYDTSIQGRLRNDTSALEFMDLIQTEDGCERNTIWDAARLTCVPCPDYSNVQFSDSELEFLVSSSSSSSDDDESDMPSGRVLLLNREQFRVTVSTTSVPSWVLLTSGTVGSQQVDVLSPNPIGLETGESLVLEFEVNPSRIASGTDRSALGTISFGVKDGGSFLGCSGRNPSFDVMLRVTPPENLNHLGSVRYVGLGLAGVVFLTALLYVLWVYRRRETRVIKVMQPLFLLTVCFGVCVLAAAVIPMSIDDGFASVRGCDIACMSVPWLVSMGFTIAFAALYAKLLRINKLFGQGDFRRVKVEAKDVMAPFAILFTLNLVVLLVWTFVDPVRWERIVVNNEDWNTVGICTGGTLSKIMVSLLGVLNFLALFACCHQAYKARSISDDFSESAYIGLAIYGWLQITVVAIPVLFLIDDNPTAQYFLQAALIFILSMSMLLIIAVPALVNTRRFENIKTSMRNIKITGLFASNRHIPGRRNTNTGQSSTTVQHSTTAEAAQTPQLYSIRENESPDNSEKSEHDAASSSLPHSNPVSWMVNHAGLVIDPSQHEAHRMHC